MRLVSLCLCIWLVASAEDEKPERPFDAQLISAPVVVLDSGSLKKGGQSEQKYKKLVAVDGWLRDCPVSKAIKSL